MTSKEALERIKNTIVVRRHYNRVVSTYNQEEIEIIEKDLEVLEIIKKYKDVIIEYIDDEILMEECFIDIDKNFMKVSKINEMKQKIKELKELKEWLNDNNGND